MFGNPTSELATLLTGVPGFFSPNPAFLLGPEAQVGVERAAMYSVDPLRKLLPELVDFDLVNSGKPRFTLGLVSVRDSQMRYFDSNYGKVGLDHVLGSSAVPPTFPAVRIDGEAYWDGGIYSNTPVEAVFDDDPRQSSVVFAVQIWHARARNPNPSPRSLPGRRTSCSAAAREAISRGRPNCTACGTSSARWSACSPRSSETRPKSRSSPATAAPP